MILKHFFDPSLTVPWLAYNVADRAAAESVVDDDINFWTVEEQGDIVSHSKVPTEDGWRVVYLRREGAPQVDTYTLVGDPA